MKRPTFSTVVLSASFFATPGMAFRTPRLASLLPCNVQSSPLSVARAPLEDDPAPDRQKKKNSNIIDDLDTQAKKLGGDALKETSDLNQEQGKLLLQIINELEGKSSVRARSVAKGSTATAATASTLSDDLVEELQTRPPSMLQLAFRLTTIELASGNLDLEWFRLVAAVSALNAATSIANIQNPQVARFNDLIRASLEEALETNMGYATYPIHKEYPNKSLKGMMKMVDGVPPIDYWFSLKKTLRVLVRALSAQVGLTLNPLTDKDTSTIENYQKIFQFKYGPFPNPLLPCPTLAIQKWTEDREFARQFFNGVNPIMIEVVDNVREQLSPEIVKFYAQDATVNLEALAEAHKLLYVDYDGLVETTKNPHQAYPKVYNNPETTDDMDILERVGNEPRHFDAPIILFELTENRKHMQILGIQLDRTPGSKVYTPVNCSEDEWQFAKSMVATADSQYHEWVSHLGKTHLTMEPHIVAIHNTLKKTNHKLYPFVKPMCRDTLFLNFAARNTLAEFGPNSFGDYMTSVGTGQFMQLILKYWETYDFFKSSAVDEELESRGFTEDIDMPAYRYRNDALKIWEAYGIFAKDYVDEIYATDEEVHADKDLQLWAIETSHPNRAAVKGFPEEFKSKGQLARTLQTLFWICSGLHAAVNFPQYDYYAYQANKPLGIRKSSEQQQAAKGDMGWIFEEAMPLLDKAQETVTTAMTLTLPSKHCITNLDEYFTDVGRESYARFKRNLQVISDEIDERSREDKATGNPVYEYLKPCNIPASIDI